jgi:hypothetical protein
MFGDTSGRAIPSGFGVPHECPEPEKERHFGVRATPPAAPVVVAR